MKNPAPLLRPILNNSPQIRRYVSEYVSVLPPRPWRERAINWGLIVAMAVALFMIVAPFWPEASYTVQASLPNHQASVAKALGEAKASQAPASGNWLLIPDIQVKAQIVEGSDIGVLDRKVGVWHEAGAIDTGNFVIAGHRFKYLPPNQTTFYNFDKLKAGEMVVVWWQGKKYGYSITKAYTVGRDATEILNPTTQRQLTLYTCTDLAASRRIVIVATPDGEP